MDLHTTRFTGRIARLFEADGFPPIAGRIFGLLLLSEDPRSLDDLAQGLGVSKASVSTNARRLATEGVLERVPRPGDRRDYYRVTPDLFTRLMTERLSRWKSFTACRVTVPKYPVTPAWKYPIHFNRYCSSITWSWPVVSTTHTTRTADRSGPENARS